MVSSPRPLFLFPLILAPRCRLGASWLALLSLQMMQAHWEVHWVAGSPLPPPCIRLFQFRDQSWAFRASSNTPARPNAKGKGELPPLRMAYNPLQSPPSRRIYFPDESNIALPLSPSGRNLRSFVPKGCQNGLWGIMYLHRIWSLGIPTLSPVLSNDRPRTPSII